MNLEERFITLFLKMGIGSMGTLLEFSKLDIESIVLKVPLDALSEQGDVMALILCTKVVGKLADHYRQEKGRTITESEMHEQIYAAQNTQVASMMQQVLYETPQALMLSAIQSRCLDPIVGSTVYSDATDTTISSKSSRRNRKLRAKARKDKSAKTFKSESNIMDSGVQNRQGQSLSASFHNQEPSAGYMPNYPEFTGKPKQKMQVNSNTGIAFDLEKGQPQTIFSPYQRYSDPCNIQIFINK